MSWRKRFHGMTSCSPLWAFARRATSLEWTIARPPRLIHTSDEGYRATRDALPSGAFSMSFRAVAAFMLDTVEHRTHVHQIVGLAS